MEADGKSAPPSRCKRDALPTELSAHLSGSRGRTRFSNRVNYWFAERTGYGWNLATPSASELSPNRPQKVTSQ